MIAEHPEVLNTGKIQLREKSDFATRLETLVNMERYNKDNFSMLQLQPLERVMSKLVVYYADQGDLDQAIRLNILALKLGNKEFSLYHSLVEGLISTVNIRIAMDTTQHLLEHYALSTDQKADLLAAYREVLTIDPVSAMKQIFIGEYYNMISITKDFTLSELQMIVYDAGGVNIKVVLGNIVPLLLYSPLFYDTTLTKEKYQYLISHSQEVN